MIEKPPDQQLLTVNETAAMLGVSRYRVYPLIHSGALKAVLNRPGGSRFRVLRSSVEDYQAGATAVPVYVPEKGAAMLTVADVAKIFGCSQETVRRLVANGHLEAIRFAGRTSRLRVSPEAVVDYQRRHVAVPTVDEKTA